MMTITIWTFYNTDNKKVLWYHKLLKYLKDVQWSKKNVQQQEEGLGEERGERTPLLRKHPACPAELQWLGKASTLRLAPRNYLQIEENHLTAQPFGHQLGVKTKS